MISRETNYINKSTKTEILITQTIVPTHFKMLQLANQLNI